MKKLTNAHRTRVTKMLIRKAFLNLLSQKPMESISIKELCEKAGINRGTFYSHYTDLYDLRDKIEEEMLRDLQRTLEPLMHIDKEQLTPLRITAEVFQCLKDNSDLCTVTLSDHGDKAFALRLINLGREICMESYSEYFKNASPKKIEYFYAFVSAGCIGLLQRWLADGMVTPAKEVAAMAENIMLQGVGCLR